MAETVFDENFRRRLVAFQNHHGLSPDGALGVDSWTKLVEVATLAPAADSAEFADSEGFDESTGEPLGATGSDGAAEDTGFPPAPAVRIEDYPALLAFATACSTEDGARRFVRDELGVDLAELEAQLREVSA